MEDDPRNKPKRRLAANRYDRHFRKLQVHRLRTDSHFERAGPAGAKSRDAQLLKGFPPKHIDPIAQSLRPGGQAQRKKCVYDSRQRMPH